MTETPEIVAAYEEMEEGTCRSRGPAASRRKHGGEPADDHDPGCTKVELLKVPLRVLSLAKTRSPRAGMSRSS